MLKNEEKDIENIIKNSLESLFEYNEILFLLDVSERNIVHHLATILEHNLRSLQQYNRYSIDIEYNRIGNTYDKDYHKMLTLPIRKQMKDIIKQHQNDEEIDFKLKKRNVFPDIICHIRTENSNLFVIEVKKKYEEQYLIDFDNFKLSKYQEELSYSFCYLLTIETKPHGMSEDEYKYKINKHNYYKLNLQTIA